MNLKAFLMIFSMMYNFHTFSEFFLLLWEPIAPYHVTNTHTKIWDLCFFPTLLCKEKESNKSLFVTSLIARKSPRTHTIKGIVLVVHVTQAKPTVKQKLDKMNIITQLKVQMTATRLEPTTTQFVSEHSTIQPNWPND